MHWCNSYTLPSRSKLASNPKSPSASQTGGESSPAQEGGQGAEAAAEGAEPQLEFSAPDGMLDVDGLDGLDGDRQGTEEDGTGVGESMMEVLEFTKSLLFKAAYVCYAFLTVLFAWLGIPVYLPVCLQSTSSG